MTGKKDARVNAHLRRTHTYPFFASELRSERVRVIPVVNAKFKYNELSKRITHLSAYCPSSVFASEKFAWGAIFFGWRIDALMHAALASSLHRRPLYWKKAKQTMTEIFNTEKLIELVREREVLYNVKDQNYKDAELTKNIWKSIGDVLGVSGRYICGHLPALCTMSGFYGFT